MNDMIIANENRKVELNNKTIELDKKQEELAVNLKILANEKVKLDEFDRSIEDEIAVARDVLKMYKDAGCKDNENINVCASKLLPEDSGFLRPMISGYVTSEFSKSRVNPITKKAEPHAAIDVSNYNKNNTLIYAVANGKVANVFYDQYGGNQAVIHHKIKSGGVIKYYSSTYGHLDAVYVKTGDVVFRNTAIGKMGNTGIYTTGAHLHMAISTGLRYKDYVSYKDYVTHSFNPRIVINFPAYRTYWSGR
jgi:murein DD-endopeptidase MepM/ murein hydrolase activator NlpD